MKFAQHFSAQRIIKQILEWIQSAKSDSITERITDIHDDGVVENSLNNMAIFGKDFDGALTDYFHVTVNTGVAYKNGERILISPATIDYDVTNPTDTTDNGLGLLVSTPHSTGSRDIPLTPVSMNYVWISYLQTTDETAFTLHKLTQEKQFYKRTDGYNIVVTTVDVNPNSNLFIKIGEVTCTGTNTAIASNISLVNREKFRTQLRRIKIETNNVGKTDRPAIYGLGQQELFLDDHIKAVGTGTVSPTNAHGLTLGDLGVATNQTVEAHRQVEHMSTIVAGTPTNSFPNTSAMYCLVITVTPGDDYVVVKKLDVGEYIIVNGITFDKSVLSVDYTVSFTAQPADTYQIVWNSTTQLIELIQGSTAVTDVTKFWLATVAWNGAGDLLSTPRFDRRRLGGRTNEYQRWFTAGRPNSPMPGQYGYNIELTQVEYYNGSTWIAV